MKRHFPPLFWFVLVACIGAAIPTTSTPQTFLPMPPSPPTSYGGMRE